MWDYPDLPGMPGMKERKVPNMEVLLDQTMLKWEVATRVRWGMVAAMPENSFKLVLRKSSSLTPTTRSKEELSLEYRQARVLCSTRRWLRLARPWQRLASHGVAWHSVI